MTTEPKDAKKERYDRFDLLERTIRRAYVLERAILDTRRVELKSNSSDAKAPPRQQLQIAGHASIEDDSAELIDGLATAIRDGPRNSPAPPH